MSLNGNTVPVRQLGRAPIGLQLRPILLGLSLLIVAAGVWRVFGLALHDPLLGYANNTDMVRLQACAQIWPANKAIKAGAMTPEAPIRDYALRYHSSQERLCQPASDLIFVYAGTGLARLLRLDPVPLWLFGLLRVCALSLAAIMFGLFFARRRRVGAAIAHSVIWAFIIADPINTLYLNTFYTEFAGVFFVYVALALLWITLGERETRLRCLALGVAFLGTALARHQHLLLPAAVALAVCVINVRALRQVRWTLAALCLASLGTLYFYAWYQPLFPWTQDYSHFIAYANDTDTFLGAVLPAGDNPAQVAVALGMPPECAAAAGKTWYDPSVQAHHPCPEVLAVSRIRLLGVLVRQPIIIYRTVAHAIPLLRAPMLDVGSVEGQSYARADRLVFSFAGWVEGAPPAALALAFGLPLVVAILAPPVAIARPVSWPRPTLTLATVLAAACLMVFMASLFGDGYFEFARHAHLFFTLWCSLAIVLATRGASALGQLYYRKTWNVAALLSKIGTSRAASSDDVL